MGIQDRDYYRAQTSRQAFGIAGGSVSSKIIIVTVVVYVLQLVTYNELDQGVTGWLALDQYHVSHLQVWRLVTYGFCHSPRDILHIVFNMLLLWWFGRELERIYGSREFLAFYVTGLVLSALFHLGIGLLTGQQGQVIGASGAIMAVMMLFAIHYPRQKILLFFVLPVEIRFLVVGYVIWELYRVLQDLGGVPIMSGIANAAHLGGLAYGYLYWRYDLRWHRLLAGWQKPKVRRPSFDQPKLRVYREPDPLSSNDIDGRLDGILAKISRQGEESLTDEERRILTEASRRFRDRHR